MRNWKDVHIGSHEWVLVTINVLLCRAIWASQVALVIKNLLAQRREHLRDVGLIPGLGRSLGGGHGNPLQYSCLENPMDQGAYWAMARRVTGSDTADVI